jgi:hypothetical protein
VPGSVGSDSLVLAEAFVRIRPGPEFCSPSPVASYKKQGLRRKNGAKECKNIHEIREPIILALASDFRTEQKQFKGKQLHSQSEDYKGRYQFTQGLPRQTTQAHWWISERGKFPEEVT